MQCSLKSSTRTLSGSRIENKKKQNGGSDSRKCHVPRAKMAAAVWRRSPNGSRWSNWGPVLSVLVEFELNWLLKYGEESSRLLEFLWIRSKRKKRERLRPVTYASVKYLPHRPNCCDRKTGCWFESRKGRRCVFGTFRRCLFCFGWIVGGVWVRKLRERSKYVSKNKSAIFFLVFLYSRHKPTSI